MSARKTLPERYQKVVALYYTNDLTMKEIGCLLGIPERIIPPESLTRRLCTAHQ